MNCIGIDPSYGKPIAWAYCVDKQWVHGLFSPDTTEQRWRAFFASAYALTGIDTLILEGGYVGKNMAVSLGLERVRGRLEACAKIAGLSVLECAPATWQAAMLSQSGVRPRRHQQIIQTTKLRVRSMGLSPKTEDEAVAILLAYWGNQRREAA